MDTHIFNLPRRKVRYWLFRFRTEAVEGIPANGAPEGLREYFEKYPGFIGWKAFAVSWDLPHIEGCLRDLCKCANEIVPLTPVSRQFSVWEEWDAQLRAEVKIFPGLKKVFNGRKGEL